MDHWYHYYFIISSHGVILYTRLSTTILYHSCLCLSLLRVQCTETPSCEAYACERVYNNEHCLCVCSSK